MELNFEMELADKLVKVWAEVSPYEAPVLYDRPGAMICDASGPNIESVTIDKVDTWPLPKEVESEIWDKYETEVSDD